MSHKFELLFDVDWFKAEKLNVNICQVQILSTPTPHYKKWYWRILNILTFKLFFNIKYTYTVKIIKLQK
jgi:hypothetical protein